MSQLSLAVLVVLLGSALCSVEQIHLAVGHHASKEMVVSWVTAENDTSTVEYGVSADALSMSATGVVTQYTQHCSGSRTPTYDYTSGFIHHTLLKDLSAGTRYFYRCGSSGGAFSDVMSFVTQPEVGTGYPFHFAAVGDLGQTNYSELTVQHVAKDPSMNVILHAGDMSYADCDQKRWDVWAAMVQDVAATRAWMVVPGNHEIETDAKHGTSFTAYKHRFAMPQIKDEEDTTDPKQLSDSCTPSDYAGNYDYGNSFYSVDIAAAHVIFLNSYTNSSVGSKQHDWIRQDLAAVDRKVTPWIIAVMHSPWYNSNTAHQGEKNAINFRATTESVFIQYGVNLVLSGHVHAYERSFPVANDTPGKGPTYINIGDGGNREGHADQYLPTPSWSAMRDGTSFGHGRATLVNASHMKWEWRRNDDGEFVDADATWITN